MSWNRSYTYVKPHAAPLLLAKYLIHHPQANLKLANQRDEDDRLPLHWAVSYNHLPVVSLLVQTKGFDADAQVA